MKPEESSKTKKTVNKAIAKTIEKHETQFNFDVSRSAEGNLMAKSIGIAMAMFGPEKGINNLEVSVNDNWKFSGNKKTDSEVKKSRVSK